MALPSSRPSNKVGAQLAPPAVNLAAYTPDPDRIAQSFQRGAQLVQQVGDSVILRPRQVAAEVATADNIVQRANTDNLLQEQERDLIPQRANLESQQMQSKMNDAQKDTIISAAAKTVAENPEFAGLFKAKLMDDTRAGANAARESAIVSEGNVATAPIRARTAASAARVGEVQQQGKEIASTFSTGASPFTQQTQALLDAQTAEAGAASAAAAPFNTPGVAPLINEGAAAAAATQAALQKQQLARTLTGGGAAPLTPEALQAVTKQALELGISITNAAGQPRPVGEITQEITQRTNVKNAAPTLKTIREGSEAATRKLDTLAQVGQLIGSGVDTGPIYDGRYGQTLDNIALFLGSDNAQVRNQLRALQNNLAFEAANGRLGNGISTYDIKLIAATAPGVANSPQTNRELITAAVVKEQRMARKNDFYNAIVPSLGEAGADTLWSKYVESNPLFDTKASTAGRLVTNPYALGPLEFIEALNNPDAVVAQKLPKDQAAVDALPLWNPSNPPRDPFVVVNNKPVPNPVYWSPIIEASQKIGPALTPPPAAATTNAPLIRAVQTPVSDLIRPLQSR